MSDLKNRVHDLLPGLIGDLEALVRIQSVSADPERLEEVEKSARKTAQLLAAEGVGAEIVRARDGAPPAVIGERKGPEGAPVVLLYAHHDVQPENDPADWDSPPFEPVVRGERLYGRGAADDKAGIAVHVGALRALGDDLPVTVRFFIEGEEEVASATLPDLLRQYRDRLAADVIVIADAGNWDIGVPSLTTSLRGLVRVDVEVRTLTHAVHSGMWGGLVPDAIMALTRLLATLWTEDGSPAVEGLVSAPAADVDYPEERLRAESGAAPGTSWIGTGSAVERLWTRPAITVTGLDAPKVAGASNTLVPVARARVTVRLAPGDTSANAVTRLTRAPGKARPVGCPAHHHGRRRGRADRAADHRAGLRRRAFRPRRGLGRHGAGRHGHRRLDPVHRGVPGDVPRREHPRHRRRGPRHPRARPERGAPPAGVRARRSRRGPAAPAPRPPYAEAFRSSAGFMMPLASPRTR